ncbi:MAG: O-antigen ligase [bacterium]|nr:O-antigen ligase [bacterium]
MAQVAALQNRTGVGRLRVMTPVSREVSEVRVSAVEMAFIFVSLTIISSGFQEFVPFRVWNLIRFALYGAVAIAVALNLRTIVPALVRSPFVTLLTILAVVSYLWSANPPATFSRSYPLVMNTLFAAYFATRFPIRQQLKILAQLITFFAVCSIIAVFIVPEATAGAAWQGIFTQKNAFGRAMALGALIALIYPSNSVRTMRLKWLGYMISLFLVFMSDSMTSLIIVVNITLLSFFLRAFWLGTVPGLALLFAGAVPIGLFMFAIATVDTDQVLIALGKDPTLTGRTDVWDKVEYAISEKFLLGYGYGAFWNQWDGMYGTLWSRRDTWQPGSAHNTFLDTWINVGILGPVLYILSLVYVYIQGLNRLRTTRNGLGLWPVLLAIYMTVLGFSEDYVLINGMNWCLYLILCYSLTGVGQGKSVEQPAVILSGNGLAKQQPVPTS